MSRAPARRQCPRRPQRRPADPPRRSRLALIPESCLGRRPRSPLGARSPFGGPFSRRQIAIAPARRVLHPARPVGIPASNQRPPSRRRAKETPAMFASFFPKPRLFFVSAIVWTAVCMALWYLLRPRSRRAPEPRLARRLSVSRRRWPTAPTRRHAAAFAVANDIAVDIWLYQYMFVGGAIFALVWRRSVAASAGSGGRWSARR